MSVTRALILAAGSARRLKPHTDDRPKCMLDVGEQPILAHQIAALRMGGVGDIAVVTGFCAETIHALLGDSVRYVHNADFAITNSIYSLWLGREHLLPGGLILNSDVLFHPDALSRLLDAEPGNCLLFDPTVGRDDPEAMKLALDADGSVERLSKALTPDLSEGENLGIIRVDAAGAAVMAETLDAMIASDVRHAWVPEVINEMRPRQRVWAIPTREPWIEIDTPEDLVHARETVWPQMAEALTPRSDTP